MAIINIVLPLFLIHNFLHEPLTEYGFHLKKVHIQIVSAFVLAFIILSLTYGSLTGTWISVALKRLVGQF